MSTNETSFPGWRFLGLRTAVWVLTAALMPVLAAAGARAEPPAPPAAAPGAPTPSPPPSRRRPPDRLGPYEIVLSPGNTLGIGFGAQLRTTLTNDGGPLGEGGRDTDDMVELRRVRLSLRGSLLDDRLRMLLQLSTSPSALELVDLWGEYRLGPALRLRFGQTRIPFTRHRQQSFTQSPLVDWDFASVQFGAERQIGVLVHDGQRGDGHINYGAGVFTGVNARASYERGLADAYAEPLPNPSNLRSPAPPADVHPELVGHVGYSSRGMDPIAPTDPEGGPPRFFVGASAAWDADPVAARDFALRFAPELLLKVRHLALDLVWYAGFFEPTESDGIEAGKFGLTAEAAYRFHPKVEVSARYSRACDREPLRGDARARADRIIAAADPADQAALTERYADAGMVRNRQETALGLNVYLVGRSLALQTDLGLLRTLRVGPDDEDEIRWRTQLQLAF